MWTKLGKINKKLNIKNIEVKKENEIVADVKLSVPIEILKFIVLIFVSSFFIMLNYGNLSDNSILREIYLYTFGLAFGDLIILVLIGSYLTLALRWMSPWFKKHYLRWFKIYTRVDYWTFRRAVIIFIWMNLLGIALVYHSVLVFQRVDLSTTIIDPHQIKKVYINGWYYSFTRNNLISIPGELPNASGNVGVYADSIFNLLYVLTFSPYLAWLIALLFFSLSWLYLITIKPKDYFLKLLSSRNTMPLVEKFIQRKTSPFYYTEQVKRLFDFYRKSASILNIDIYKVKFSYLLKKINKNINVLSKNKELDNYFKIVKRRMSKEQIEEIDFERILKNNQNKYSTDPDLIVISPDSSSVTINTKGPIRYYKTNEKSSYYDLKNFDTIELDKTKDKHFKNEFFALMNKTTNINVDRNLNNSFEIDIYDNTHTSKTNNEENNQTFNFDITDTNEINDNDLIQTVNTQPNFDNLENAQNQTENSNIITEEISLKSNNNNTKLIQNINFDLSNTKEIKYKNDVENIKETEKTKENSSTVNIHNDINFDLTDTEEILSVVKKETKNLEESNELKFAENTKETFKNEFLFNSKTFEIDDLKEINNSTIDDDNEWESPILADKK